MRGVLRFGGFLILILLLVAGCSTQNPGSGLNSAFLSGPQKERPHASKLATGDSIELSVEVDGNMEIPQHQANLDYQGIATLPLVGDVKIGGMTLDEARSVIAEKYGAYYVNSPVIMLSLANDGDRVEWGNVTVLGRVNRPGLVPLTSYRGINLSAAIQAAGGFAGSAKTSEIRISRVDEKGKKHQVFVDFEQIGQKGNAEADLKLMAGDIVYVPERIF